MLFIDSETHIWRPFDDIAYFPNYKKYVDSVMGVCRLSGITPPASRGVASAEELVKSMDEGGVQWACVLPEMMLDISWGHRVRSTNGQVAMEIEPYRDRLIGVANVGPVIKRGVENAIWELEYFVKEKGFKGCKVYPPDDCPINDKIMWPLYQAIRDLGIVLFVHTGLALVKPGRSAYCHPMLLEEVCDDFPEIPIVAYHMGWPYHHELIALATMYQNVYIQTSLMPGILRAGTSPTRFAEIMGELIEYAGSDKLIWGTDWSGRLISHKDSADFVKNFQIPEELQKRYGWPAITDGDRERWAGLNLVKLLKIKV